MKSRLFFWCFAFFTVENVMMLLFGSVNAHMIGFDYPRVLLLLLVSWRCVANWNGAPRWLRHRAFMHFAKAR